MTAGGEDHSQFIPASLAIRCGDCGGFYSALHRGRDGRSCCPGCGSAERAPVTVSKAGDFDSFWESYRPHKKRGGKLAAQRAFSRAAKRPDWPGISRVLSVLLVDSQDERWRAGFVPHVSTWINEGRYLRDDVPDMALEAAVESRRQRDEQRAKWLAEGRCPECGNELERLLALNGRWFMSCTGPGCGWTGPWHEKEET